MRSGVAQCKPRRPADQPDADPSESPATWLSSSRIVQRACLACNNRRRRRLAVRRLAVLVHQVRRLAVHRRRVALVLVARHLRQVPPRRRNRGHRSHSGHRPSWSQQRRGMRRHLANKQSPKPPFVSPSNTDTPQRLPRRWHRRRLHLHRRARDQPQPAGGIPSTATPRAMMVLARITSVEFWPTVNLREYEAEVCRQTARCGSWAACVASSARR